MSGPNGREIIVKHAGVGVLLPLAFKAPFDYRVPEGMELKKGDFVRVPFGRKSLWGVVWGHAQGGIDPAKLKTVECLAAHLAPIREDMRAFIEWVAWYTLAPLGMVLKMAMPVPEALGPPQRKPLYRTRNSVTAREEEKPAQPFRLTPARARIIAYLSDNTARSLNDIVMHAKVSAPVVREFLKAGGLDIVEEDTEKFINPNIGNVLPSTPPYTLSPDQETAASILRGKLTGGFSVTLLDGVTGSGKTEVYFDAVARCISGGGQALVLLPEIALSVQWLARFKAQFGFAPHIWHSAITPAARARAWRAIADGAARVVVGARSALFLPFLKLRLIVVDEEHDASYKQEEGVIYHARDMAVSRARHEKIMALLVSATPSLETVFNIEHGRYSRIELHQRHNAAELPAINLIDMRQQKLPAGSWISEPLKEALRMTFSRGQQAMLFLNRRGYAPLMLCRACGHRLVCPHCSVFLVLHRKRDRLLCHHCSYEARPPQACPDCKQTGTLIAYGPGVERIAEEAASLLPDARIRVMTSDESGTPAKLSALVHSMIEGEIDILIGTQMIAKGHHFAGLALVGVMDADMGLAGGDLRAGERTYQMLHQVSGRAGREKVKGEVLLQTYMPDHPVMQALVAGDRDRYMALEASMRQDAGMPPYGKLAAIIVEGAPDHKVADFARMLVRELGSESRSPQEISSAVSSTVAAGPLILGPAPAPISLLRGRHRWRILIKVPRNFGLQEWLADALTRHKTPSSLKVKVDIEPYSFM